MNSNKAIGGSLALLSGMALFSAVQAWLFRSTAPVPGIEDSGWFLNAGRGVATVGLAFMIAGTLVGLVRRDAASGVKGATLIVAGGAVAMVVILFLIGPGNIFPIVIAFGTVIIGAATALGTGLGMVTRRLAAAWTRR